MKKLLIILFIGLSVAGCSTTPVSLNEIKEVPKDRVFKFQNDVSNYANLVLIRDIGHISGGCYINLFINGEEVARLERKERVSLYVPSGNIIIGSSLQGKGLCGINPPRLEREFTFKDGERKVFRLFIDQSGNPDIIPTTLY